MISDCVGLCLFGWANDLMIHDKLEAVWCWGSRIHLTAVVSRWPWLV